MSNICARLSASVFVSTGSEVLRLSEGRFAPLSGLVQKGDGSVDKMTCGADGSLWVGFSSGAIKHWKNSKIETFSPPLGLPARVAVIYEDHAGGVWAILGRTLCQLRAGRFEPLRLENRKDLDSAYSMHVDREGRTIKHKVRHAKNKAKRDLSM